MTTASLTRRNVLLALLLAAGLLWPALTAAAPAAPATGPLPNNICFVANLYLEFLHRPADPVGMNAALFYLASHTRPQYATTLLAGDEYRTVLIQALYQRFLGRPADNVEIANGLGALGSGSRDEDLIAQIVGSQEYFALPGIDSVNANFVKAVYHDLLGRTASAGDVSFGVSYVVSNTRQQFVTAVILPSTEYRADIIQAWYQRFLGRSPTPGELSSGQSTLSGGGTDEQIIAIVVGSDEYFARGGLCRTFLPLIRR